MSNTRITQKSQQKAIVKPKEADVTEVLPARPVTGKIDHLGLTRRIIARFPKILAALAK